MSDFFPNRDSLYSVFRELQQLLSVIVLGKNGNLSCLNPQQLDTLIPIFTDVSYILDFFVATGTYLKVIYTQNK